MVKTGQFTTKCKGDIGHSAYDFLFSFHISQKVGSVLHHFRDSVLFVKSFKFFILYAYVAPPLGVTPLEFHKGVWHQKTTQSLGVELFT